MRKKMYVFAISMIIAILAVGCSDNTASNGSGADNDWSPEKSIEIVAPSGAGGGWDTTARMAAKVLVEEGTSTLHLEVEND